MKKKIFALGSSAMVFMLTLVPSIAKAAEGKGFNVSNLNQAQGVASGTASDIAWKLINWLLAIVGILGVAGFVVAGILYILAAGDDTKLGNAKKIMTFSIVGVVVALLGYVAVSTIKNVIVD